MQRMSEYEVLVSVIAAVRLMADSKEAMDIATKQGPFVDARLSLEKSKEILDHMNHCIKEAERAKAHDAPEVPPLQKQIQRVGPIVEAKQEVHDSTVAQVSGQMTVQKLRGAVTERMNRAKEKAQKVNAYGGAEAAALEARLKQVEEMAAAKVECAEGVKAKVEPTMSSQDLRSTASRQHEPRLQRAQRAGVADSPEYAELDKRMKYAIQMAGTKDEMTRLINVTVNADTSLKNTSKTVKQLEEVKPLAEGLSMTGTSEYKQAVQKLKDAGNILGLKQECHKAAQDGNPQMPVQELRGRVTDQMNRARDQAQWGSAYGGDVKEELEKRLIVVSQMADGKSRAKDVLQCTVSARVSIPNLKSEAQRLREIHEEVKRMHAEGSPEVDGPQRSNACPTQARELRSMQYRAS